MQNINDLLELIPNVEDLDARPKRCILHWTAGTYVPNETDKSHYHYLITPDGVTLADRSVNSNMRRLEVGDLYAAHTRRFNSFSVGFSFCGMRGASPGRNFGKWPLIEKQVRMGLQFVSLCTLVWGMNPLDPHHVFTHYEAEHLHGVDQVPVGPGTWKWDITELEFKPELEKNEVGRWLRREIMRERINAFAVEPRTPPPLPSLMDGVSSVSEVRSMFSPDDPEDLKPWVP